MKKISLFFFLMFISTCLMAQDTLQKITPKEKKKFEKEELQKKQFDKVYKILSDSAFVLEANYLTVDAKRFIVNSMLNFILVDTSFSVLQIGSDAKLGYNGVGGSTAKGKITKYELTKNDERKTCLLQLMVSTMAGPFSISFDVSCSGHASAVISLKSGELIYEGNIIPLEESNVYKGNSWY
jgi:hypothetical protein